MELNVNDTLLNDNDIYDYQQEPIQPSFEKIPENTGPVKVIKKGVTFQEQNNPMHRATKIAPKIAPNIPQKISYEDILSKMGMFVAEGKLHLMDNNPKGYQQIKTHYEQQQQQPQKQPQNKQHIQQQIQQPLIQQIQQPLKQQSNIPANSYIYNKFFKEDLNSNVVNIIKPRTLEEYNKLRLLELLNNIKAKQRASQIKSTKLIMSTENINISSRQGNNLNKLFNFSK